MANIFETLSRSFKSGLEEVAEGFPLARQKLRTENIIPQRPTFTPQRAQEFQKKNIFQQLASAEVGQQAAANATGLAKGVIGGVVGIPRDIGRGFVGLGQEVEGAVEGRKPVAREPQNIFEKLAFGLDPVQPTRTIGQETVESLPGLGRPSGS